MMEAIMKKITWAAPALLLMILMVLGLGCSTKSTTPTGGQGGVGTVQIVMPADTLRFLPGDSASAQGFVVVKDDAGRVMAGIKVNVELTIQNVGSIEFLGGQDTTDAIGRVYILFRTYGQVGPGYNTIHAWVGSKEDNWTLWVQSAATVLASLRITLSKDALQVAPPLEDSVQVTVTISDSSHNGVPGITLPLRASGGRLAQLPATDASGRAQTWWYSNNELPGDYTLSVRAGGLADTARVHLTVLPPTRGTLSMTTSKRIVHADRCITRADIAATLWDQRNVAQPNDTVFFSSTLGTHVTSSAITDSQGIAHVTFCAEDVSLRDSAYVACSFQRWGLVDTLHIMVDSASAVASVALTVGTQHGVAGVDSTSLAVSVRYADLTPVNLRYVHLISPCRPFSPDSFQLQNGGIPQSVFWRFCDQITVDRGSPLVAVCEGVRSDTMFMTVNPGPSRYVNFSDFTHVIPIQTNVAVCADVTDSLHNPVRNGQSVVWSANLGTMSPTMSSTDQSGHACTFFNGGTTSGQAIIKATIGSGLSVDSTLVSILAGGAATVQLDVSNPSPQVRGTGGMEWTQLQARVRDANGNPAPDGIYVVFRILSQPPIPPPYDPLHDRANINRAGPDHNGIEDSTMTSGGVALATFNSGVAAGPVIISACVMLDSTQQACATVSNISIVSGPPRHIEIQANNVGTDGHAVWIVPVQAVVTDVYNNPVRDGVAVFFSVTDTASILSDTVVTGNGNHQPGIAETALSYIGAATNQFVDITARTAGDTSTAVSATITYQLPIQQPTVHLYVQPASWQFTVQGNPCHIMCMALVEDGHQTSINGQNIIFGTTRGRLYPTDLQTPGPNPVSHRFSGFDPLYGIPDPNGFGHATLYLVDLATWIFPDPLSTEITGNVQVDVEGHPEATDSRVINFRRGNGRPN